MAHLPTTTNSGSSPAEGGLFGRVTIVGVGLIGGSLGLALRERGLAGRVVGVGHARPSLDRALERGAIDEATVQVAEGVEGADVVVLAVPVGQICPLGQAAAGHLARGAQASSARRQPLVIDVGSTKARVVALLEPLLASAGARFVGCHPLAGSERRSVEAARADLFEGAVTVLTPTDRTDPAALEQAEAVWRAVGSKVVRVSPAEHDALVALSSHLPHAAAALVAVAVRDAARRAPDLNRLADFVAGGFRDTTRVASSDPLLWRDILLDNRQCVAAALEVLGGRLEALRQALLRGDGDGIADLLAQAKETRDALIRRSP